MTGSSSAAVVLTSDAESHYIASAADPITEELAAKASALSLKAVADWVASGSSCWTMKDPQGQGFPGSGMLRAAGAATVLVVPLGEVGPPVGGPGLLLVADEHPADLATDIVELLELLGTHITSCARIFASLATLRRQASRDPLTDLRHHAAFHAAVADTLGRGIQDVAVVILDIDNFKSVNYRRGHPGGDALLCNAARVLSVGLRNQEELYRIGGDEFATVLQVTSSREAMAVAERLQSTASAELGATISVGVALLKPGEPPERLIARADHALCQAKRCPWP